LTDGGTWYFIEKRQGFKKGMVMKMKKALTTVLSLCVILTLFAGCGGNAEAPPADTPPPEDPQTAEPAPPAETGGLVIRDEYLAEKVTIGVSGGGDSLTPWGRAVFGQAEARNIIIQKLLRADSSGNIYYELAKDVEKVDELTYKITLWDCIYDSEGNPFTAGDVLFSMEQYLGTGNTGFVNKLDHLEAIDDYTVLWHCTRPFAIGEFATQMANANMVTQVSFDASSDEMTVNPVGTGAYKVKEFTPGSVLVLEADENFWMKKLPEDIRTGLWIYNHQNVREIEYHVIRDASARAIALETGSVDIIDNISDVDLEAYAQNPNIVPVYTLNRPPIPILFNCSDASPFADINMRKAVCFAIDNAAIAAGIGAHAYRVFGFQPNLIDAPDSWLSGREYYDYSEAKAKEYLEKAGYNNEALTLMFVPESTGVSKEEVAVMLQSQLRKLGINVVLKSVDQAVNAVDRFDENGWDMRMDEFGGGFYMVNVMKSFTSESYMTDLKGKNIMLVADARLDALFTDMENDPNEATIDAYDDYFTYEMCYAYGVIGAHLRTASRANVHVALGDRGSMLVPSGFTFD
jgi:ABC-type transport system substrate-binding protein